MEFEIVVAFLMATLANSILGVDGGVLADVQIRKLGLAERAHNLARSATLFVAALGRLGMILLVSSLAFLLEPQADVWWLPNRWFSQHPEDLTWKHLLLFFGAGVVMAIVIYEYWHGFTEAAEGPHEEHHEHQKAAPSKVMRWLQITAVLLAVQLLLGIFGVDQVFLMMSLMDIETELPWMIASILIANAIMIIGMVPISKLISRSPHTKFLTLAMLVVISAKLAVDGTGGHFSDGILMFILGMLMFNDAAQAFYDRLIRNRERRRGGLATPPASSE